jgi:hypothetical protein
MPSRQGRLVERFPSADADLQISRGQVNAIVGGSDIYQVKIAIETLPAAKWDRIKMDCAQSIDSLIDLLRGRFDQGVMKRLTERETGRGAGGPQGRRTVVLVADHGANRKPAIEEKAGHGSPDRPELTRGPATGIVPYL